MPFVSPVRYCLTWLSRQRLPQTQGQAVVDGLTAPVEILRDHWGIPHIYAHTLEDGLFGQGYVHAQDRLWQMDFIRRLVAGRLSEVFGRLTLPLDRWMRILGLRRAAEQESRQLPEIESRLVNSYCAGVNAAIGRLPVEFTLLAYKPEPWQPADSLAWRKLMSWMLSTNWECELVRLHLIERLGAELAAELDADDTESWPIILEAGNRLAKQAGKKPTSAASDWGRTLLGPGPSQGVGSNNWVLSGSRSTSGKPLLANDMHLGLTSPAIWYENHLCAGELNVTGVSLPGVPLVVAGHNARLAWGFTAGFSDIQDLYAERLRRVEDGVEYEFRGGWLPAEVRHETIRVRGRKSEVQEVIVTHHGPIINDLITHHPPQVPYAMCFPALEAEHGHFGALLKMNLAGSIDGFHQALRGWSTPSLNAVYADVEGGIAYTLMGRVPIRAQGDGSIPVPGWTGEYEWTGTIPFDEMPHVVNPPQGVVVTANNRVAGKEYPYFLGKDYIAGDRAERIHELLAAQDMHDLGSMRRIQFDQVSPTARDLARALQELELKEPELDEVVDLLRRWDGQLDPDQPAAAVYQVLVRQTLSTLLEARLGDLTSDFTGKGPNPVLATESLWGFHAWAWLRKLLKRSDSHWFNLGRGESRADVMRLALRRTVGFLKQRMGPQLRDWTWGRLHTLTFNHVLGRFSQFSPFFNRGPYPLGGDSSTVWAATTSLYELHAEGMVGPPFRFIVDLADMDHALGLLAPGQSGNPASPHYDDQVEAWFNGGYHPMLFRREEVEQHLESRMELHPREGPFSPFPS